MQHAGLGVEHRRIAWIDLLQHVARITDGRNAERLGDDGDMAGRAAIREHQPPHPLPVVVEQFRRPHRTGDQDGVARQIRVGRRRRAAGEQTQQTV